MLPDVAFLEIFDYYLNADLAVTFRRFSEKKWHTLVHVCRKWRNVVFGSPLRLNLRLHCKASTPVRETLNVWPPFPIVVWDKSRQQWGVDNIIAALEHNDRICELDLCVDISSPQWENALAVMQQPFPALTYLSFDTMYSAPGPPTVIPASFLGGSAPQLQFLHLDFIPFPGLPKLLLSATHLVWIDLWNIPHSGYISPETMVTCMTRLESLHIVFESPQSRPDQKIRRPLLRKRTLLPVFTELRFKGVSEYLEDLVARMDAPLLDVLAITFFHPLIFDTPQLTEFISRTPKLKTHDEARVLFNKEYEVSSWVSLPQTFDGELKLGLSCEQSDWQLLSLAQFCSSSFPRDLIHAVEHPYILEGVAFGPNWRDDVESSEWLELLRPFSFVKNLYLCEQFALRLAPTLQELVGGRTTEVLPALQNIFIEGLESSSPVHEGIGQFVAAQQFSTHSVAVFCWERKQSKWDEMSLFP
jgi:hypothetical protein